MKYKGLGEKIQRYRIIRGYTQEKLAERIGISTTHMGHIEQGRRIPSMQVLEKLAKELHVRVKDLIPF